MSSNEEDWKSLYDLSLSYMQNKRQKEADMIMEKAIKCAENKLGADHPMLVPLLGKMAWICASDGDRCLRYLKRELEILLKAYGEEHDEVIHVRNIYGKMLLNKKHYQEAIFQLDQAAKRLCSKHGAQSELLAEPLNALYKALSETKGKISLDGICHLVLGIKGRFSPYENNDLFELISSLASECEANNHLDLATELLQRFLVVVDNTDHTDSLYSMFLCQGLKTLGLLYKRSGQLDSAEMLLQRAYLIRESEGAPSLDCAMNLLKEIADLYANMGRAEEASNLFDRINAYSSSRIVSWHF